MRRACLPCAVLMVFALLVPFTTHAEGKSVRTVGTYVMAKNAASQDASQLVQELMRQVFGKLKNVHPVYRVGGPRSVDKEASEALEAGYRALNGRDYSKAQPFFKKALSRLEAHVGPDQVRALARALKGLAICAAQQGHDALSRTLMADAINLWPKQRAVEYAYNMDLFHLFSFVAKKHSDSANGDIEVNSEPSGAHVYINGEHHGASPVTKSLKPGRHWVEVRQDGFVRSGRFVQVKSGDKMSIKTVLPENKERETRTALMQKLMVTKKASKATPVMTELLTSLAVDGVFVWQAQNRRGAIALSGWYGNQEGVKKVKLRLGKNLMEDLQNFYLGMLQTTVRPNSAAIPLDGPPVKSIVKVDGKGGDKTLPKSKAVPITKKWWFWTATGGTVAAITIGVILAVVLREPEPVAEKGNLNLNFRAVPQ